MARHCISQQGQEKQNPYDGTYTYCSDNAYSKIFPLDGEKQQNPYIGHPYVAQVIAQIPMIFPTVA